jgi:tetratricopeptide (TPR) repeat protein
VRLSECRRSALRDKRWKKIMPPPRSSGAGSSLRLSAFLTHRLKAIFAWFAVAVLAALAPFLAVAGTAAADTSSEIAICDAVADYPMLTENYPQAIRLHLRVLAEHPGNALGHYHLGFAYGMLGDHAQELVQYRKAVDLGLKRWDLFVNLGVANLEAGDLEAAAAALTEAVATQPNRPEPHFNLGLVYERRRMLPQAEREFRTSLQLDPNQPDASNMLGVIYAEQHDIPAARRVWTELVRKYPNYGPAHENLSILDSATATENASAAPRDNSPSARIEATSLEAQRAKPENSSSGRRHYTTPTRPELQGDLWRPETERGYQP